MNAEEEPENPNYPWDPAFRKTYGPRGVLKSIAGGKIEDTGPLTKKRMETIDEEFFCRVPMNLSNLDIGNVPVLFGPSSQPRACQAAVFLTTLACSSCEKVARKSIRAREPYVARHVMAA